MTTFVGSFSSDGNYWYSGLDFVVPPDGKKVTITARMRADAASPNCDANLYLWLALGKEENRTWLGSRYDHTFSSTELFLNPVFESFQPGQHIYLYVQTGGQNCRNATYALTAEVT